MADFQPNPRTPESIVSGFRGPENQVSQNVIADVSETLHLYTEKKTPLVTLTGRLKDKESVTQRRFDWIEQDDYPRQIVLTGAALVADTTLDVTAGEEARVGAGYILMNTRTREQVRVTSTASGVLTVTRAYDSGNQVDMVAGDTMLFLAYIAEDGADVGTSRSIVGTDKFNYTGIVRTEYSLTGRDINTSLYTGKDLSTTRKVKMIEHAKSIEFLFYFGKRASFTGTSHEVTSSYGLENQITSNVWDLANVNTINQREFDNFLVEALRWGPNGYREAGSATKYALLGSHLMMEVQQFAKDKLEYRVLDKEIGFKAMEYQHAYGRVMLMGSPILDEGHAGWGFILDMDTLTYMFHQGRDTKLYEGRQGNGVDGKTEEYLSDVGLRMVLEGSNAVIKRFKESVA